ncbi:M13 family metallopeptidase [Streptomyces sp. HB132]|uniref:M13 family metallopeptidase n=1 Tax=Streptomyces sp. HB132 TaxID=767388 RepID=UPI001961B477|nr:M13-type metalloendopeptidase [Streptomyces sp. HB132]MBM7443047.1 endothelin-converting enzyme/putative endopeptidase [Streptomyces sp. HB132]
MNHFIRPQDDLYGHVNNLWHSQEEIPADRSSWGTVPYLIESTEKSVGAIIQEISADWTNATHIEDARKIAALYTSFMGEQKIATLGLSPVLPLIRDIWKLRDNSDLSEFLGRLERIGGSGLFGTYVNVDDRNSQRYLFNICQGGLSLPDSTYYLEDRFAGIRERHVAHLVDLFTLARIDGPLAAAESALAIDVKIAEGHWSRAAARNAHSTYNLVGLDELKTLAPSFDWHRYTVGLGCSSETISEVCVRQPSYLAHVSSLMTDVPVEKWRSWLLCRVLKACAPYLSDEFVKNDFEFHERAVNGTQKLPDRHKQAVRFVQRAMGEAVGREYVMRHFPPGSLASVEALVSTVIRAYRVAIDELEWMTDTTKGRAHEKLDELRIKIGHPKDFINYGKLSVEYGELLENAHAVAAWEVDRKLAKIGSRVDRDEWFMLPQKVNAYYDPGANEICFPAAVLQRPFFSLEADLAENYGGIGAVIAHEIGHAFDDQGAKYDGRGNLNDWWTAEDRIAFEEKTSALIEQFDRLSPRNLPGEFVNGELTVGENIGDLGGIAIAHRAYLMALGDETSPQKGGITDSQRLFLHWALCWRTKRHEKEERRRLAVDPHSPPELRANVVRNLSEFHDEFGTREGDGLWLDPQDRVRIW